jgi:sugar phosphate isomerase/epimerase
MLLTLATRSVRKLLSANGEQGLSLYDLPEYAIKTLQLRGLNLAFGTLLDMNLRLEDLDQLRDRADKAGCPCLVLVDEAPLALAARSAAESQDALQRAQRLAVAANRLGCSAIAISCGGPDTDDAVDATVMQVKTFMPQIERLELTLLLRQHAGSLGSADRLTELIKRIGGFRIGSLPDFGQAAASGELLPSLRKLAPYAGAVHATVEGFTRTGAHKGYDLSACVEAIRSVGFVNTVAIDFTGGGDPLPNIERARAILQAAIDAQP